MRFMLLIALIFLEASAEIAPPVSFESDMQKILDSIDDSALKNALLTILAQDHALTEALDDRKKKAEIYSMPEVRDAIQTALEKLRGRRFDEFPLPAVSILKNGAIRGAIITGDKRHIEALKALTHSDDPAIRDAIYGSNAALLSVNFPIEVFREAVLSAEERLPTAVEKTKEFEDSLREFEFCVSRVAEFGSRADRKEFLEPIVQRFLNRYSDPRVRSFWEPRLRRTMDFRTVVRDGNPVDEPRDSDPPSIPPAAGTKGADAVPHVRAPAGADGSPEAPSAPPLSRPDCGSGRRRRGLHGPLLAHGPPSAESVLTVGTTISELGEEPVAHPLVAPKKGKA